MNKLQLSDLSPEEIAGLPDYQPALEPKKQPVMPPFLHEATKCLMDRNINIAHTSSLRKFARALRIAWGARGPIDRQVKGLPFMRPIIRAKKPKVQVRFFGGSRRLSDRSKYMPAECDRQKGKI